MDRNTGLFSPAGRGEGLLTPGIPVHRVAGVLEQVGALLVLQSVHAPGLQGRPEISSTGRISIVPTPATGTREAMPMASSRSPASMR